MLSSPLYPINIAMSSSKNPQNLKSMSHLLACATVAQLLAGIRCDYNGGAPYFAVHATLVNISPIEI